MSLADAPSWALFGLIVLLTVTSAYFSGSETAMMAVNRYRLRHLVKERHSGARKANKLLRRPDRLLGVILFFNNLVNFTAASIATVLALRFLGESGVLLAPVLVTVFFLIFAEVAPKTLAAQNPERLAFASAHLLEPLQRFTQPVVAIINYLSNAIVKPFLPDTSERGDRGLTMEELRTVVNEGLVSRGRRRNMMLGIMDLEKVSVDDIMVPRSEIVGLDIDDEVDDIYQQVANAQHTRLPVFREDLNHVIGILHLRKLARYLQHDTFSRAELITCTEEPYYVPEQTPLHTQLFNFQQEKKRIALVVDEYGDVQGIVTLEDILEEIVGEFTTDFATNMPEISPQPDGSYVIDGRAVLRDINRALGWDLPTNGPKTLNGLVLEHIETFPDGNLSLRIDDIQFETLQIKDNVIKSLRVLPTGSLAHRRG